MKLLKTLTIVLFSLLFFVSVSFSQEGASADNGADKQLESISSGGADSGKAVPADKTEKVLKTADSAEKKKAASEEIRKIAVKKTPEKKPVSTESEAVAEKISQIKNDSDLLPINEGNFKYQRIPDIKLAEVKPEPADSGQKFVEAAKPEENKSSGFLGLSKTAMDIIVKGGILLLILVIFIIYKSRMSYPGAKKTKRRKVLNSYRK